GKAEDRNTGGLGQYFGNHVFVDFSNTVGCLVTPFLFFLVPLILQRLFFIPQGCCTFEVLTINGGFFFHPHLFNACIVFFDFGWSRHPLNTQPCTSLVDQINGLIRQETIRNVTVGHGGCPVQGFISDGYTVVCFIPVP